MPSIEQCALWHWFLEQHPNCRLSPKQLNCFLIVFFFRPPLRWSTCWRRLIKEQFIKGENFTKLFDRRELCSYSAIDVPVNSTLKMPQGRQTCHISLEGRLLVSHSPKLKAFTSPWLLHFPGFLQSANNSYGFVTQNVTHAWPSHSIASCPQMPDLFSFSPVYIISISCSSQEDSNKGAPDSDMQVEA